MIRRCAISNGAQKKKKNPRNLIWNTKAHRIRSVSPNDADDIVYLDVSIILQMYISISRLIQKEDAHQTLQCASPIDMQIAL